MKKIDVKYLLPGGKSPVQNDENNKSIQAEYLDTTINKLTKERVKTRDNYVKKVIEDVMEEALNEAGINNTALQH